MAFAFQLLLLMYLVCRSKGYINTCVIEQATFAGVDSTVNLVGTASIFNGSSLSLQAGTFGTVGGVWTTNRLTIPSGVFCAAFSFTVSGGGDGFAFVTQDANNSALSGASEQLGVGGLAPSAYLGFDYLTGPSDKLVFGRNGSFPPEVERLTGAPLADGSRQYAWINASPSRTSVYWSETNSRPPLHLFSAAPMLSSAWMGFTCSAGLITSTVRVHSLFISEDSSCTAGTPVGCARPTLDDYSISSAQSVQGSVVVQDSLSLQAVLSVDGDLVFSNESSTSTTSLSPQLLVNGTAVLGGSLVLQLPPGLMDPGSSSGFVLEILQASSVSGSFSSISVNGSSSCQSVSLGEPQFSGGSLSVAVSLHSDACSLLSTPQIIGGAVGGAVGLLLLALALPLLITGLMAKRAHRLRMQALKEASPEL